LSVRSSGGLRRATNQMLCARHFSDELVCDGPSDFK